MQRIEGDLCACFVFYIHTHSYCTSSPSCSLSQLSLTHTHVLPLVDAYLHATPQTAYEYNSITLFPPEQLADGKAKCVQDKINATTDRPTERTNERTNDCNGLAWNLHLGKAKTMASLPLPLSVCMWVSAYSFISSSPYHSLPPRSPIWKYIKRNISKILFNQYLRTAFVHHACIHERAFGFSFFFRGLEAGEKSTSSLKMQNIHL